MSCKQVCTQYQFDEGNRNWGKYEKGIKRCSFCNKYLELLEQQCPCCKNILKSKAKKIKQKNQMHQNFIYKKFRLKLNLNHKVVDNAKNLEEDFMRKVNFDLSPHVMATACIFMVTRLEQPKELEEILSIFQIPEVELRYGMAKICEGLPDSQE